MSFSPLSIETLERLAAKIFRTGILSGADFKTEDHVFAVMLAGQELGIEPMQAVRGIGFVKGKLSLTADLTVALCVRSPVCKYFRLVETTMERAVFETQREGSPTSTTLMWTIEQARVAGLLSNATWRTHPSAMLRARCASALARSVYPDLVAGIYNPDEVEEIERAENVAQEAARLRRPPSGTDESPPSIPVAPHSPASPATSSTPEATDEPPPERSALWRLQVGLGDAACTTVSSVGKLWQELAQALHLQGFENKGRKLVAEHLAGLGHELASDEVQAVLARTLPPPMVDFFDALASVKAVAGDPVEVDGAMRAGLDVDATVEAIARVLVAHRDRLDAHQRKAVTRIATRKLVALGVADGGARLRERFAPQPAPQPAEAPPPTVAPTEVQ